MTVKIDGTNTEANPAFTGADTDTGLQCGTNELKLVTGGTARATVDSSGRIGLDATPTAQFTGHSLFQIGAQASLGANQALSTTGQTYLTHNLCFDTSGNYQVFNTGSANEGSIIQLVDGSIRFRTSAATTGTPSVGERVRIDANGLKFNGDTAAANALHDYEEGTFTPRLAIENGGDVTVYTNKKGSYVKVGSLVTVWFNLTVNGTPSNRSTSNAIEFHDLPFDSTDDDNDGAQYYIGSIRINDVDTSHTYGDLSEVIIRLNNNSDNGRIVPRDASSSGLANGSLWLKDNTSIHATITYRTDA